MVLNYLSRALSPVSYLLLMSGGVCQIGIEYMSYISYRNITTDSPFYLVCPFDRSNEAMSLLLRLTLAMMVCLLYAPCMGTEVYVLVSWPRRFMSTKNIGGSTFPCDLPHPLCYVNSGGFKTLYIYGFSCLHSTKVLVQCAQV